MLASVAECVQEDVLGVYASCNGNAVLCLNELLPTAPVSIQSSWEPQWESIHKPKADAHNEMKIWNRFSDIHQAGKDLCVALQTSWMRTCPQVPYGCPLKMCTSQSLLTLDDGLFILVSVILARYISTSMALPKRLMKSKLCHGHLFVFR